MSIRYIVHSIDVMGIPLVRYYEYDEVMSALKRGIITPRLRCPLHIWGYPSVLEFHYDSF